MRTTPTAVQGAAVALILVTGAIHFIDAPGSFGDATYKGILFVANSNRIGKYNATTGEVINASFITGLDSAFGLALLGDALFVADFLGGRVGVYDTTNGARSRKL